MKQNLKDILSVALEQEAPELEPVSAAPAPKKEKMRKTVSRTAIFGGLILIFAAIGLVWSIVSTTRVITNTVQNTATKEKLLDFAYPLIMLDPPIFKEPKALGDVTLVSAAVWNVILNEDTSKYPHSEYGDYTVPAIDVEASAYKLFGQAGIDFTHQTVGEAGINFFYDPETKSYNIPATLFYRPYTFKVSKLSEKDNIYTMTVDYYTAQPVFGAETTTPPEFIKSVVFQIKKDKTLSILSAADIAPAADDPASTTA